MTSSPKQNPLNNLPEINLPLESGKLPVIDLESVANTLDSADSGKSAKVVVPDPVTRIQNLPTLSLEPEPAKATGQQQVPAAAQQSARAQQQANVQPNMQPNVQPATRLEPAMGATLPGGGFVPMMPVQAGADSVARDSGNYTTGKKKVSKLKIALIALIVAAIGYTIAWFVKENMKDNWDLAIKADSSSNVYEALTPTVSRDPFYMMLIGSDSRNDGENERSDTNIVARIDPTTGTVNLISIPRDTAINYENYGTVKFNAAYAYDGAAGAIKAAEGLLGIRITHYAEVDFGGLVAMVDIVGGVDVDVPMRIEDANAGDQVIEAGPQHLDGEQALIFARSRSYANGDFQRTANQRILIEALLAKVMGMNDFQLAPVIEEASQYMTSDMGVRQMQDYAILFRDYPEELKIYSIMMPSDTAIGADGTSYVVCNTTLLKQVMTVVNAAGDPSYLITDDSSVYSSEEAQELGMESTPIYVPE